MEDRKDVRMITNECSKTENVWRDKQIEEKIVYQEILKMRTTIEEYLSGDTHIEDIPKVDYLLAHKDNRLFLNKNNLKKDDVLKIILNEVGTKNFCHAEEDSQKKGTLYCFNLNLKKYKIHDCEEVLFKFKIREEKYGQVFVMSFHYPNKNKEPWTHLF